MLYEGSGHELGGTESGELKNFYTLSGGTLEGTVTAGDLIDLTDIDPPFTLAWGVKGLKGYIGDYGG